MNTKPPFRKLRGYAFDPSLSQKAETAGINSIVYKVPWEDLTGHDDAGKTACLKGEYLEIVDYDPTVGKYYRPVNLNDPYILAQDGLDPSEGNPMFHQQMVYAVAMTTIRNFERALGRKVIWAPRRLADKKRYQEYVQHLRIYPHALREANAYYSPQKKALLFGYFSATPSDICLQMPGSLVFTCLSHDIIAHETTHAILDGMHRNYNNPTNPDVLAFHEAFADIVALFQHFTFPEVLKKQIAETRGDLGAQNLLGKLAQEFGTAIGKYGSLRDAIGQTNENGEWSPTEPSADDYRTIMEPHARGSILVAAIFEAFINIYKSRVKDLLRISTNGTGILPQGELLPDLVNRMADEAARTAGHVLKMCIRALDYCPPVDITFGDFLRAIITADVDLVADDERNYRLFIIDAFRRRGIYPQGLKTLSVESLCYAQEPEVSNATQEMFKMIGDRLRDFMGKAMYETDRCKLYDLSEKTTGDTKDGLHRKLQGKFLGSAEFSKLTGLVFYEKWGELGIRDSNYTGKPNPSFQIQNLRLVSRVGPDNRQMKQIVLSLVQRSGVIARNGVFNHEHYCPGTEEPPADGFELWGGCTLIFDLDTLKLKYAISRPLLDTRLLSNGNPQWKIDKSRVEIQAIYRENIAMNLNEYNAYFGDNLNTSAELFACLHQH